MADIIFNKVTNEKELFNQKQFYEDNFEKVKVYAQETGAELDGINAQMGEKAPILTTYTKTEVDDKDNLKANILQPAWITPTLLNGATGSIQYRKNDFGKLEFKGSLTGTYGSVSFALMSGYRPSIARNIIAPRSDATGYRVFLINSSGNVVPNLPSGTYETDLSGSGIIL